MAANKFATMLHRNTNKITFFLVYAFLEWVLIILLLLNSLFSYLIIKFADYFGLRRPCLWCSRLDHLFEPTKFQTSCRSLVCEAHAMEISKLGFCSNHRKLAESQDMCEDCSSSSSSETELSKKFAFFPWMKQLGVVQDFGGGNKVCEDGEVMFNCSCCGVSLERKLLCPDYYLIKPSWGDSDYTQKGNSVLEPLIDDQVDGDDHFIEIRSGVVNDRSEEEQRIGEHRQVETEETSTLYVSNFDGKEVAVDDDGMFDIIVEGEAETEKKDELNVAVDDGGMFDIIMEREVETEQKDELNVPVDDGGMFDIIMEREVETKKKDELNVAVDDGGMFDIIMEREVETEMKDELNVAVDDGGMFDIIMEREVETEMKDELNASVDDLSHSQPAIGVEPGRGNEISSGIQAKHLEFYIDGDDCHLIPIELMGPISAEKEILSKDEKGAEENCENEDFVMEFDDPVGAQYELVVEDRSILEEEVPLLLLHESEEEPKVFTLRPRELPENDSSSLMAEDKNLVMTDNFVEEEDKVDVIAIQNSSIDANDIQESPVEDDVEESSVVDVRESSVTKDAQEDSATAGQEAESDNNQAFSEGEHQLQSDETEADVSIGTEIPDHEQIDDFQCQEIPPPSACMQDEPSTSNSTSYDGHDLKQVEEDALEFRTLSAETRDADVRNHFASCYGGNENEEDVMPDTPSSIDNHNLHKKLLLLERRDSATEESLDGSVISDIEASGVLSVEKLKTALRAERKALNMLYAELEEERSASAVAANQTMAMINRLQEEKAAMQMEALQYQRMMEEQAEYDQEALQLLNELMLKREKEKAELEKEVELYRNMVHEYGAKEKILVLNRRKNSSIRSGTSSGTCSNAEDSDGLSLDLNHEGKEEDNNDNHQESSNQNTPVDAVLYLEESLATFEEERLSILEQLRVLEGKLFTLSDEEELHFEDIKSIEDVQEENGNGYNHNLDHSNEANGVANGHHYKEMNGKHHQERKNFGAKAKRLLPLFDATTNADAESEDRLLNGHAEEFGSIKSVDEYDIVDSKKLAIEEEVDHVYERLQALEADREFLRHCITSLKKGDKGIELLQEILHHLRDLRSVELRARNIGDGIAW